MHTLKIKRAVDRASVGRYPGSCADMLGLIPASAIAALSSAALAELLDAMWAACQASKRLAEQAAVAEGVIWDGKHLREIAV